MITDNPEIIDTTLNDLKRAYATFKTHDLQYRKG